MAEKAKNIKDVMNGAWGATYPVDGIHVEKFMGKTWISVNGELFDDKRQLEQAQKKELENLELALKTRVYISREELYGLNNTKSEEERDELQKKAKERDEKEAREELQKKHKEQLDSQKEQLAKINSYHSHPISQATSFLGMPNRMHNLDQEQTRTNIFYNFIGWEEDVSPLKKAVNLLLMPFRIPLNLLSMPFKWVVNTAKLVTEFLPLVARDSLKLAAERAIEKDKDSKLATALNFFSEGFNVMYVLLRPITSPIQNVRDLWNQDKPLWAFVSVFQTGAAYTALFPLVVYGLVVSALPAIVTQLPAIMGHMPTWLSTIMSPVLAGMAKVWPFVAKHPAAIGTALGYGIPTVGNLLDYLSSKVAGWFRGWGKVNQPQGEEPGIIGKRDDEPKPENEFKPGPNDEPKPAPQVELNSDSAAKDEPKAEQPDVPGSVSVINEKLQHEEEKRAEEDRAAKENLEQEEKEKQRLIEEQRQQLEEFEKQKRAEEERATKEAKEKLEQEEKAIQPVANHSSAMFSPTNPVNVNVAQSLATSVSEEEEKRLEESLESIRKTG